MQIAALIQPDRGPVTSRQRGQARPVTPRRRGAKQLAIASLSLLLLFPATAHCEVFVLDNGGQVEGRLLNPEQSPRETFVIETPLGTVTLAREQVAEIVRNSQREREYEAIRPTFPDTPQGQWELAEWCRQHRLGAARTKHLERVIELDPDHAEARRALGYSRRGDRWVTPEQIMTERGYVRYKGRWLTPQDVQIIEKRRQADLAEKSWYPKIKRWRGWLDSDRAHEAARNFRDIDDPSAVGALEAALRDDPNEFHRLVYLDALTNINSPQSLALQVDLSLEDPSEEVRLTALEYLAQSKPPDAINRYISQLRSKNNRTVNRAAVALAHMQDPGAIGPLIDALVTTHTQKIVSGSPGGMGASFGSGPGMGGGGFTAGQSTKIIKHHLRNPAVLDALVALTGANFDFDIAAWKTWHANHHKPPALDARRD